MAVASKKMTRGGLLNGAGVFEINKYRQNNSNSKLISHNCLINLSRPADVFSCADMDSEALAYYCKGYGQNQMPKHLDKCPAN